MAFDYEQTLQEAAQEADESRQIRAERDRQLSPEERLERLHALCAQLAAIRPVDEPR
jgi:hypothetical protein